MKAFSVEETESCSLSGGEDLLGNQLSGQSEIFGAMILSSRLERSELCKLKSAVHAWLKAD